MKKLLNVDKTFNGMRIDRFLRNYFGQIPQSLIEKNLRNGKIKLNKKKIKSSKKIQYNDKIELYNFEFKKIIKQKKEKYNPSNEIVKENEDLIIENAKNRETAQLLTSLFRLRKVYKTYLAICNGELTLTDKGMIEDDLIRYENKKKIIEKAKTKFEILDKNNNSTFIKLNPITGRKHQLRKQLFNLGNSIIGDKKYNSTNNSKINNKNLMLHSYEIKFKINDKKYTFRATPPNYFRNMLKTKRLNF